MSQNALLVCLSVVAFVAVNVLEHFGLVPLGTANVVYGVIGGALGVSGAAAVTNGAPVTFKPTPTVMSQGSATPTKSPVNDLGSQG